MTKQFGWIVTALAVTLSPGSAFAQNNTCSAAAPMAVDDMREFFLTPFADGTTERFYTFVLVATRSYCVELVPDAAETNFTNPILDVYTDINCATLLSTNDDDGREPPLWLGSRVCFVPAVSGFYVAKARHYFGLPANRSFDIRVIDTTLFSPYWQVVTAAGYDAAPQIRNNTNQPLTVYFTTYDAAGAATGCNGTAIVLPANGMSTFTISSTCGISSGFGSAQIAHNAAPGAVTANITTFSASSGLSFDAAFHQRQKNNPVN